MILILPLCPRWFRYFHHRGHREFLVNLTRACPPVFVKSCKFTSQPLARDLRGRHNAPHIPPVRRYKMISAKRISLFAISVFMTACTASHAFAQQSPKVPIQAASKSFWRILRPGRCREYGTGAQASSLRINPFRDEWATGTVGSSEPGAGADFTALLAAHHYRVT